MRWFVTPSRDGHPRLLIIDDVPTTNTSNALRLAVRERGVAQPAFDQYAVMRLQNKTPFRSAKTSPRRQSCSRSSSGTARTKRGFSTFLRNYRAGVEEYVNSGGKMYLEGLYLFEGAATRRVRLTESFVVNDILNCNGITRS